MRKCELIILTNFELKKKKVTGLIDSKCSSAAHNTSIITVICHREDQQSPGYSSLCNTHNGYVTTQHYAICFARPLIKMSPTVIIAKNIHHRATKSYEIWQTWSAQSCNKTEWRPGLLVCFSHANSVCVSLGFQVCRIINWSLTVVQTEMSQKCSANV